MQEVIYAASIGTTTDDLEWPGMVISRYLCGSWTNCSRDSDCEQVGPFSKSQSVQELPCGLMRRKWCNACVYFLVGSQTQELREPDIPGSDWVESRATYSAVWNADTERPVGILQPCALCQPWHTWLVTLLLYSDLLPWCIIVFSWVFLENEMA